jgi:hypothetical protein
MIIFVEKNISWLFFLQLRQNLLVYVIFGGWNQNRLVPSFFFLCRPLLADWKSSMIVASWVFKTWQRILDDCRWRRWDKRYNWSGMSDWDRSDEGGFESFLNELSRAEEETHAFDYQDKKYDTLSSSDVKVGVVSKFLTFDLAMDWRTNWIKKYEENVVFIENVEVCDDQLWFFWCLRCSRSQILTTTQSSFSNKFKILFRFFFSRRSKWGNWFVVFCPASIFCKVVWKSI